MDISKEETSESFTSKSEIQSKHYNAVVSCLNIQSHCIVFGQQELLITIGNDGQFNLYRQNNKKQYEHQATKKMYCMKYHSFDCPVAAYDILEDGNFWKLVVVSLDNRVAACKIIDKKAIVVFRQIQLGQKYEQISSCAWLESQNRVILGGENGNIFILDLNSREKAAQYYLQSDKIKLLRRKQDIFIGTKSSISKLALQMEIKSKVYLDQSSFTSDILDFAITQKDFCNFLVVLTKDRLYFYYFENFKLKPQIFLLKNYMETGRLGWGKDFNQIAIYQPLQEGTDVEVYACNLSGIWSKNPF